MTIRYSRAHRDVFMLAALLLLAGCAAATKIPSETDLQSAQQFEARRLDNSGLEGFMEAGGVPVPAWPLHTWNVNQLNLAAFYYSPDLDVARAQWHTVKAAEITAGQIPNPSVGFSPTWDETNLYHLFLPFNLNVPVETAGKRELRIQTTQDQSKSAQYKVLSAAWTVRNRLINSLIGCYAADQSLDLYRKQAEDQKPIVDLFEQRTASGQSLSLNASQILVAYQQTLLAEKDAERQQAEAKADLASALGVPLDAISSLKIDWNNIASVDKKDRVLTAGARQTAL
ncbi:MAG: TolC family protein, partial [Alphaproteobacteria bacterium]|nr:TolC family protein [Alphaproteobacteria bacterium]